MILTEAVWEKTQSFYGCHLRWEQRSVLESWSCHLRLCPELLYAAHDIMESSEKWREHLQSSHERGLKPTAGRTPKKWQLHVAWCIEILPDLSIKKTDLKQILVLQCRRCTRHSKCRAFTCPLISNRKHHPHGYGLASTTNALETETCTSLQFLRHYCIARDFSRLNVVKRHEAPKTEKTKTISCEPWRAKLDSLKKWCPTMCVPCLAQ